MKKIMLVFGTRPEAIKMAPVVKALEAESEFKTIVCVTGQHREMLNQVLETFDITPDYNLDIMKEKQTLSDVTSNILISIQDVLRVEKPDIVLVHGDTTTTFTTALAAFYEGIKIGHVEAGLRTNDIKSPFPEEFNREVVGLIADLHFAATEDAANNLRKEGKSDDTIFVTGNTVIDALKTTVRDDYTHPELDWASDSRLILMTAHRRENLGEPLKNIAKAVLKLVEDNDDVKVIYPVHLNPKVKDTINPIIGNHERIHLIDPLDVLDFHNFIARSYFIMSDSGGIQEEAPSLGKPVLVLRDNTERPEGVEAGTLKLVGTNPEKIQKEAQRLLNDEAEYNRMAETRNPYGDGKASERITNILTDNY